MTDKIIRLGNIYGEDKGTGFAGNVWDINGLAPTINTAQGGNRQPMILEAIPCAMRGRYTGINGQVEQNLEIHNDGISNCIISVEKDSLVIERYE